VHTTDLTRLCDDDNEKKINMIYIYKDLRLFEGIKKRRRSIVQKKDIIFHMKKILSKEY
jgi:hypothetical protein